MKNRRFYIFSLGLGVLILVIIGIIVSDEIKKAIGQHRDKTTPRQTTVPSSNQPDLIRLTWVDDPCTSIAISWRTNRTTEHGVVHLRPKNESNNAYREIPAQRELLEDNLIENDPSIFCYFANIHDLEPGIVYEYRVGDPKNQIWSEWREFRTAPSTEESFSFLYFGDIQHGFEVWEELVAAALEKCPQAAFALCAGDLVNRGNFRDEWDRLFQAGKSLFETRPIVPCIGNHERPNGSEPVLYLQLLQLPGNGVPELTPEKTYSVQYGNALFVILDSNESPEIQIPWLENQLASTNAVWKFVMCHHPMYSSKPNRDNPELRALWCPIFEKYGVDIVFQGHDHAYLRTHPLRNGQVVDGENPGTIYVISVAGTKYYELAPQDIAATAFANISTYQIIDIDADSPEKHRLTYRAYDQSGNIKDEFVLEKPK